MQFLFSYLYNCKWTRTETDEDIRMSYTEASGVLNSCVTDGKARKIKTNMYQEEIVHQLQNINQTNGRWRIWEWMRTSSSEKKTPSHKWRQKAQMAPRSWICVSKRKGKLQLHYFIFIAMNWLWNNIRMLSPTARPASPFFRHSLIFICICKYELYFKRLSPLQVLAPRTSYPS